MAIRGLATSLTVMLGRVLAFIYQFSCNGVVSQGVKPRSRGIFDGNAQSDWAPLGLLGYRGRTPIVADGAVLPFGVDAWR